MNSHQKISDSEGGFTGRLDNFDVFGWSVASLGDLDGDGVGDLAVAAMGDDDGGGDRGAVWILFLNTDGTVKSHQKISDTQGGFTGILDDGDWFGTSVADGCYHVLNRGNGRAEVFHKGEDYDTFGGVPVSNRFHTPTTQPIEWSAGVPKVRSSYATTQLMSVPSQASASAA